MGYSNYDVAHAWANERDKCHNGSSMSHSSGRVYSYSTVIGQILHCPNGNTVYLLNNYRYSPSTQKHQSLVQGAIPNRDNILYLSPYRFEYGWTGLWVYPKHDIKTALEQVVVGIIKDFYKLLGCFTSSTSLTLENEIQIPDALIRRYIELTDCTSWNKLLRLHYTNPKNPPEKQDITTNIRRIIKLLAKGSMNISEYVAAGYGKAAWERYFALTATARKARETRRAKEDPAYIPQDITVNYDFEAEAKRIRRQRAEKKRRQEAEMRETVVKWCNNEIQTLYNIPERLCYGGNVILRVRKDNIVQTSKGIALSVDECARLWKLIRVWHEDESKFSMMSERSVMAIRGNWTITRYENDLLTAGCHTIAYQEMENLARALNFPI